MYEYDSMREYMLYATPTTSFAITTTQLADMVLSTPCLIYIIVLNNRLWPCSLILISCTRTDEQLSKLVDFRDLATTDDAFPHPHQGSNFVFFTYSS